MATGTTPFKTDETSLLLKLAVKSRTWDSAFPSPPSSPLVLLLLAFFFRVTIAILILGVLTIPNDFRVLPFIFIYSSLMGGQGDSSLLGFLVAYASHFAALLLQQVFHFVLLVPTREHCSEALCSAIPVQIRISLCHHPSVLCRLCPLHSVISVPTVPTAILPFWGQFLRATESPWLARHTRNTDTPHEGHNTMWLWYFKISTV